MDEGKSMFMRVLTWIWRIVTGVYRLVVIVLILVALGLLWLDWHGGPPVHVDENVALVIHPHGALVEQIGNSRQAILDEISGNAPSRTSLRSLRRALRAAATDPRIGAAVLDFDDMTRAGVAQLQELGRSIDRFRKSGKPVYAYGLSFDQYQYLPAAHADSIALDPLGSVFLQGFGVYTDYFKDALDKLGVQVNVFRVGAYKSAVEPFIRNDMSPDAQLANKAWLGDLWTTYQADVISQRKLAPGALDDYIAGFSAGLARAGGNGAQYALQDKLVTTIQTRALFRKTVEAQVGYDKDTNSFRQISVGDYLRARHQQRNSGAPAGRIGVVVVQGDIVDGDSDARSAGGDTIAELLDRAQRDDSVAAVVLRVNSPGGSVVAAEKIRRAVQRVKAAGKPVVVSMSTMAASGGYWISMDADKIYAEPSTITGSIGIFGLLPTIGASLNKIGIHSDGVGTSPLAGAFRIDRPMTQPQRAIIQAQIDFGYRKFITGVSKGRGLPLDTVKQIAQGRVWSGLEAKKLGLVDAFGGLHAAVTAAASLVKLAPGHYRIKVFRPSLHLLRRLLKRLGGGHLETTAQVLASLHGVSADWLRPLVSAARLLQDFNDPKGEYAYCFCTPAAAPTIR